MRGSRGQIPLGSQDINSLAIDFRLTRSGKTRNFGRNYREVYERGLREDQEARGAGMGKKRSSSKGVLFLCTVLPARNHAGGKRTTTWKYYILIVNEPQVQPKQRATPGPFPCGTVKQHDNTRGRSGLETVSPQTYEASL